MSLDEYNAATNLVPLAGAGLQLPMTAAVGDGDANSTCWPLRRAPSTSFSTSPATTSNGHRDRSPPSGRELGGGSGRRVNFEVGGQDGAALRVGHREHQALVDAPQLERGPESRHRPGLGQRCEAEMQDAARKLGA